MFKEKKKSAELISRKTASVWITHFSIILILLNSNLLASPEKNRIKVESLGKIMVLEEGRIKPLDTYARNKLIQFSGKQKVSGLSALQWISRVLLNPDEANDDLIFLIDNPEVADALGISPRARRRYSFFELYSAGEKLSELSNGAMNKDAGELTAFDRVVINTDRNLQEYFLIRSTFSFLEPLPYLAVFDSSLSQKLGVHPDQPLSYFNLLSRAEVFSEGMQIIQKIGKDSLSPQYSALLDLTRRMYDMEKSLENPPPHLIPGKDKDGQWLGLWGLVNQYKSAVYNQESLKYMVETRDAYLSGDQEKFDKSVSQFSKIVAQNTSPQEKLTDPSLELFYNRLNPFFYAKVLYGLAALISLLSIALLWKKMSNVSLCFVITGIILHTTGIVSRMIIMSHPPITNLYETFVFTAWAAVIIGIVLEWLKMGSVGTITAAVTGFLFLHIAGKYARDGDTLGMLIAVLDSSFWLTTHIVTISLGYAGYIGAGLVGHIYLVHKMVRADDTLQLQKLSKAVSGIFYFGLLFTVIGTMFGGMWADQAWGRFWGWDPKENGALLLILWGLIVVHAKLGGMIKSTGYAIGAVIGAILVMSAWIGVNLLGVGLHSYGFTSSGAMYLYIYLGVEIVFLTISGIVLATKNSKSQSQIS